LDADASAAVNNLIYSGCEFIGQYKFDATNDGSFNSALAGNNAYIVNNIFDINMLDSSGNPTVTYLDPPVALDFSNFARTKYFNNN
jgi:hypothetical protein